MRETKIIIDSDAKYPCGCYERTTFGFFSSDWEKLDEVGTPEEALEFLNAKDGKFLGIYLKDGTPVASEKASLILNKVTRTSDGTPIKKSTLHEIPKFPDDDETVLHSRKIGNKK